MNARSVVQRVSLFALWSVLAGLSLPRLWPLIAVDAAAQEATVAEMTDAFMAPPGQLPLRDALPSPRTIVVLGVAVLGLVGAVCGLAWLFGAAGAISGNEHDAQDDPAPGRTLPTIIDGKDRFLAALPPRGSARDG